ncbi:hypothetical protein Ari01nite_98290 [Paractinoplanes rishiriensis]|uniref:Signal transduction histidine kinase subgroup 3 dimerisation and phosphoacceptor domain-containing protein n=1 Tax=Paractinoplanes rishiriensis TaxID=1050105 RepID=A0A919KBK2_9ACTN|nr:hypothetical protein Ari01nite_98290 [Actinoplanes rishiriensis]
MIPSGLRRLNRTSLLPVLLVVGAVLVARDARGWTDVLILSTGVLAAAVAFWRWAADEVLRVALPCTVVAAAVWPLAVVLTDSPNGSYGLAVVAAHVVPQLPRHRIRAAVAVPVFIGVVGATRLLLSDADARGIVLSYVVVPVGVAVVTIALMFPNKGFYDHVKDLEAAREREAELAVARERVRFASDLHDIQGHTLHVVKLKTALAQRLVRADPDRAEEELREIHALVGDTINQTKALAYAQRRLNLTAELENAKNLFEAAGIDVRITREAEVARSGELLGQVLRETTTNILRHAQATRVRITLSEAGIAIDNDGVRGDAVPELRGLAALRQRVADGGGELTVQVRDGRFRTAAAFPGTGNR